MLDIRDCFHFRAAMALEEDPESHILATATKLRAFIQSSCCGAVRPSEVGILSHTCALVHALTLARNAQELVQSSQEQRVQATWHYQLLHGLEPSPPAPFSSPHSRADQRSFIACDPRSMTSRWMKQSAAGPTVKSAMVLISGVPEGSAEVLVETYMHGPLVLPTPISASFPLAHLGEMLDNLPKFALACIIDMMVNGIMQADGRWQQDRPTCQGYKALPSRVIHARWLAYCDEVDPQNLMGVVHIWLLPRPQTARVIAECRSMFPPALASSSAAGGPTNQDWEHQGLQGDQMARLANPGPGTELSFVGTEAYPGSDEQSSTWHEPGVPKGHIGAMPQLLQGSTAERAAAGRVHEQQPSIGENDGWNPGPWVVQPQGPFPGYETRYLGSTVVLLPERRIEMKYRSVQQPAQSRLSAQPSAQPSQDVADKALESQQRPHQSLSHPSIRLYQDVAETTAISQQRPDQPSPQPSVQASAQCSAQPSAQRRGQAAERTPAASQRPAQPRSVSDVNQSASEISEIPDAKEGLAAGLRMLDMPVNMLHQVNLPDKQVDLESIARAIRAHGRAAHANNEQQAMMRDAWAEGGGCLLKSKAALERMLAEKQRSVADQAARSDNVRPRSAKLQDKDATSKSQQLLSKEERAAQAAQAEREAKLREEKALAMAQQLLQEEEEAARAAQAKKEAKRRKQAQRRARDQARLQQPVLSPLSMDALHGGAAPAHAASTGLSAGPANAAEAFASGRDQVGLATAQEPDQVKGSGLQRGSSQSGADDENIGEPAAAGKAAAASLSSTPRPVYLGASDVSDALSETAEPVPQDVEAAARPELKSAGEGPSASMASHANAATCRDSTSVQPAEAPGRRSSQQRSKRSRAQQNCWQAPTAGRDRADLKKPMHSPSRPEPAQHLSMPCSSDMGSDLQKPNAAAHLQAAVSAAARQGGSDPMQSLPAGAAPDATTSSPVAAGNRPKPMGLQHHSVSSPSAQTSTLR